MMMRTCFHSFARFQQKPVRKPLPWRVLALEHLEDRSLLSLLPTATALGVSAGSAAVGQPVTFTATPTVNVTDAGGTYNGLAFPATATVASTKRFSA